MLLRHYPGTFFFSLFLLGLLLPRPSAPAIPARGSRLDALSASPCPAYNAAMKSQTLMPPTEGAIWARIVDPEAADLTVEAARTLLQLDFKPADRQRMEELAERARLGRLSPRERKVAETYNTARLRPTGMSRIRLAGLTAHSAPALVLGAPAPVLARRRTGFACRPRLQ